MSDDLSIPTPGYRGNRAGRYGTGKSRTRPAMDPDTSRLLMIAGGLAAVLLTLVGASVLIAHRAGSPVPVIAADPRPVRVKPDNPGGMKIDGAENDVFTAGSDTADAKLSAAAETPDRKALRTSAASPPRARGRRRARGRSPRSRPSPLHRRRPSPNPPPRQRRGQPRRPPPPIRIRSWCNSPR